MKKIIFIILFSVFLIISLIFIYLKTIVLPQKFNGTSSFGPPININNPNEKSIKLITKKIITKDTTFPFSLKYPLGTVVIKDYFFGNDIWTSDNIRIPKVVVKEGETPQNADFGFGILLNDGIKLSYASFRKIRPDGSFDSRPYKIIGEKILKVTKNEMEDSKLVEQYRIEVEPITLPPDNLSFKILIESEEVTFGKTRFPILH